MNLERRRVTFSGRVQGVGFRFTTIRIAENFPVVGYVQNLPDGRVALVAKGEPSAVRAFVDAVRAEHREKLDDVDEEIEPAQPLEFSRFSIKY